MTGKVVLVGAGGIGRHHLSGLMKAAGVSDVQVVERSALARDRVRDMLEGGSEGSPPVTIVGDVEESWGDPSLTIVATQARGRISLVKSLLARGHRQFLLEKLVCQSETEYAALIDITTAAGARVWVNAPLRYNEFFQRARALISGERIVLSVVGSEMGLGSNAIHFVDLFLMLRGEGRLTFHPGLLAPALLPNKRGRDLHEFGGTLMGVDATGSMLSVSNLAFAEPTQTINISSEPAWFLADVVGGTCHWARRDEGWQVHSDVYRESRVSEVTGIAAASILANGASMFPDLQDLYDPHRELFRVFSQHIEALTGDWPERCPVT